MKEVLKTYENTRTEDKKAQRTDSGTGKSPENTDPVKNSANDCLRDGELEKIRQEIKLENLGESPFRPGEIFDEENELKIISSLKRDEKKASFESFKEKLSYQKKGLALIEKISLELIKKNPEITIDELEESAKKIKNTLALTKTQNDIIHSAFSGYCNAHNGVKEHTREFIDEDGKIDGEGLYKKLFLREPNGRVNVIIRPFSIFFRVENLEDYSHVAFQSFEDKNNWLTYKVRNAKKEGGAKIDYKPIPELKDSIIIENCASEAKGENFFDKLGLEVNDTLLHEEQHAYNDLFLNAYDPEAEYSSTKSTVDLSIERLVKNEISAYFKGNRNIFSIHKALLDKETIYPYGFSYKNPKAGFDDRYIRLVEDGITAFDALMELGLNFYDIQAILYKEPLAKWKKIVERTVGRQMNPLTHKEFKEYLREKTNLPVPARKKFELFIKNLGSLFNSIRSNKNILKGYEDYSKNKKRKI